MEKSRPPLPQADQAPHPALLELSTLYALQPRSVRSEHLQTLYEQLHFYLQTEIEVDVEFQIRRGERAEHITPYVAEHMAEDSDEALIEFARFVRDRELTILAHVALAQQLRWRHDGLTGDHLLIG